MVTIDSSKMEYRYLGNSGIRVSVLSFGNFVNNMDDSFTVDCVKLALSKGVNFFDTAEAYGFGKGEETLGKAFKALKVPREKIVVSTKIYKIGPDPNDADKQLNRSSIPTFTNVDFDLDNGGIIYWNPNNRQFFLSRMICIIYFCF